jgi:hypothetical protein
MFYLYSNQLWLGLLVWTYKNWRDDCWRLSIRNIQNSKNQEKCHITLYKCHFSAGYKVLLQETKNSTRSPSGVSPPECKERHWRSGIYVWSNKERIGFPYFFGIRRPAPVWFPLFWSLLNYVLQATSQSGPKLMKPCHCKNSCVTVTA